MVTTILTQGDIAELAEKTKQNVSICLDEGEKLIGVMLENVYSYMADTDQVLTGNGITKGPRKDVSSNISGMKQYINEHRKIIELEISTKSVSPQQTESIIDLKPNFFGIGVNLNALFRKIFKKTKK